MPRARRRERAGESRRVDAYVGRASPDPGTGPRVPGVRLRVVPGVIGPAEDERHHQGDGARGAGGRPSRRVRHPAHQGRQRGRRALRPGIRPRTGPVVADGVPATPGHGPAGRVARACRRCPRTGSFGRSGCTGPHRRRGRRSHRRRERWSRRTWRASTRSSRRTTGERCPWSSRSSASSPSRGPRPTSCSGRR